MSCSSDPAVAPTVALPAGGHVLRAQQHIDTLTAALLTCRDQPTEIAALQQYFDDLHSVARAAISALHGPAVPPARAPRPAPPDRVAHRHPPALPARAAAAARTPPEPMARYLHQRARFLLSHASIGEPVTWEPPFDWVTGITWPGLHPDGISPADLHPVIRSGLPVRAIAARLGTTAEHVRLTAARHPAPPPPPGRTAQAPTEPELPGTDQLRAFTEQGYGPRKIARTTGCSERAIRQRLNSAGLRQPPPRPRGIDPHWLREQYQARQRSLKDIAVETGIPVESLAAAARNAGIPVRHGMNGHAHPLANLGTPSAFPPAVWSAFTRPNAEQRIRRLLALPGQPSLQHAARQLGIRHAILASQIRQLETATGTTLLRIGPDGTITLTADGEQFARNVRPVLESPAALSFLLAFPVDSGNAEPAGSTVFGGSRPPRGRPVPGHCWPR